MQGSCVLEIKLRASCTLHKHSFNQWSYIPSSSPPFFVRQGLTFLDHKSLKLTMSLRLASNSWPSSCFSHPSAEVKDLSFLPYPATLSLGLLFYLSDNDCSSEPSLSFPKVILFLDFLVAQGQQNLRPDAQTAGAKTRWPSCRAGLAAEFGQWTGRWCDSRCSCQLIKIPGSWG